MQNSPFHEFYRVLLTETFYVLCNFLLLLPVVLFNRSQDTQSLNRCDLDVQINALARRRMCNEKFFILITVQLAWCSIGISHSFYSHHVCLIASVALTLVPKGCFTSDRVRVIISSIELYDLVKNSILIPPMTPC